MVDASADYSTYGAALKGLNATSKFAANNGFVTKDFPTDQWVTEVVGWEKFIWSTFQTYIADYAVGYNARVPQLKEYIQTNLTKGEQELCSVQRMVKPSGVMYVLLNQLTFFTDVLTLLTRNISVLGLTIVITLTTLFTLADLVLLKFVIFLKRSRRALAPRTDRWVQDGVFQLQRRAYEAFDEGIWERQDTEVPATVDGQLLCELSLENSRHCCTHICAKKGGDVVMPRMGIKRGMTVMSDATTVYDATNGEASSKSGSLKKGKSLNNKASLNSMLKG